MEWTYGCHKSYLPNNWYSKGDGPGAVASQSMVLKYATDHDHIVNEEAIECPQLSAVVLV